MSIRLSFPKYSITTGSNMRQYIIQGLVALLFLAGLAMVAIHGNRAAKASLCASDGIETSTDYYERVAGHAQEHPQECK
jgi:hypothetical protein